MILRQEFASRRSNIEGSGNEVRSRNKSAGESEFMGTPWLKAKALSLSHLSAWLMQASRRANLLYTPLIALPKRILPYKTHRICANHTSAVGWGSGVRPLESQLRHSAAADFFFAEESSRHSFPSHIHIHGQTQTLCWLPWLHTTHLSISAPASLSLLIRAVRACSEWITCDDVC